MSVQAAVTSANDFFQAVSPRADNSDQAAALSQDGSRSDFKKVLMSARDEKPRNSNPQANSQKTQKSQNKYGGGIVTAGEYTNESAESAPGSEACPDVAEETGEPGASRFNPDLILGNPDAPKNDPEGTEIAAANAGGEPELTPELSEGSLDEEPAPNDEATEDAGKIIPFPDIDASRPIGDEKISAENNPANDAIVTNDKNIEDLTTRPDIDKSEKSEQAPGADANVSADAETEDSFPDILKAEGGEPEQTDKNKSGARDAGDGTNESSGDRNDAPAAKTDQPRTENPDRKVKPDDNPDAAAAKSRPASAESRHAHESDQPEALSRAGEATPAEVNAFGGLTDAGARAETPGTVRVPVTYTLVSGNNFGEGLLNVVQFINRGESSEVRIIVEPPALGRVDVSLKSSANGVEAQFRVDNEALRQMVQNQLDSLKESLRAQGIHVSGLTVDIRNGEGENFRGGQGSKDRKRARGEDDGDLAEDARIARLDLERGLLHWVA